MTLELQFYLEENPHKVRESLRKTWDEILGYIQSEYYRDGDNKQPTKHKGLWYFTQDILLQYIFYLTGLYFQNSGRNGSESGDSLYKARYYYLESF